MKHIVVIETHVADSTENVTQDRHAGVLWPGSVKGNNVAEHENIKRKQGFRV